MSQNERDLAAIVGMNTFAAFVVLYQNTIEDFLDSSPEARAENYGRLIGVDRIVSPLADIQARTGPLNTDANSYC